jgi:hypothetical protein
MKITLALPKKNLSVAGCGGGIILFPRRLRYEIEV